MKSVMIALLAFASFTSHGKSDSSVPFDAIINKKLFVQFSNYEESTDLKVFKEEKEGFTEYSLSPLSGIYIRVGPAYSILPKGKIEEDRQSLSESRKKLEKALEDNKDELTEEKYQETKKALKLFHAIMAGSDEDRYPELGSQALQTGWTDGDTIIFTTTDKKYDLEIKRMFTEEVFFRVPEMAQWISDTYDKLKTQPGGGINDEAAPSS